MAVLVSWEGMIWENTLKEEWTGKNDFNDNYNYYGEGCIQTLRSQFFNIFTYRNFYIYLSNAKWHLHARTFLCVSQNSVAPVNPTLPSHRFCLPCCLIPTSYLRDEQHCSKIKKRRRSNVVVSCNREKSLKQLVILFGWLESYDLREDNKEEWTNKNYSNDNYSYIAPASLWILTVGWSRWY